MNKYAETEYSIGEFSKLTDLSIHTLRYYEKEQLITPARDSGNRRRYSEQDLAWVEFIQRLKDTGMPIKEIKRYASLRRAGDATLPERMEMLKAHHEALEEQILEMLEHRRKLEQKISYYREEIARAGKNH